MRRPWLEYYQDITQICKPLQDKSNQYYFGHAHIRRDGSYFTLANNPAPSEYYLHEKGCPPSGLTNFDSLRTETLFLDTHNDDVVGFNPGTIQLLKNQFDIENMVVMVYKTESFAEFFCFSFKDISSVLTVSRHYDFLQQFVFYYKERASKIIENASVLMPRYDLKKLENTIINESTQPVIELPINNYWITTPQGNVRLTKNEYQIFKALGQGYQIKEVANLFDKPYGTIKNTIEKIRIKLNAPRKADLRELYRLNHPILLADI